MRVDVVSVWGVNVVIGDCCEVNALLLAICYWVCLCTSTAHSLCLFINITTTTAQNETTVSIT